MLKRTHIWEKVCVCVWERKSEKQPSIFRNACTLTQVTESSSTSSGPVLLRRRGRVRARKYSWEQDSVCTASSVIPGDSCLEETAARWNSLSNRHHPRTKTHTNTHCVIAGDGKWTFPLSLVHTLPRYVFLVAAAWTKNWKQLAVSPHTDQKMRTSCQTLETKMHNFVPRWAKNRLEIRQPE